MLFPDYIPGFDFCIHIHHLILCISKTLLFSVFPYDSVTHEDRDWTLLSFVLSTLLSSPSVTFDTYKCAIKI